MLGDGGDSRGGLDEARARTHRVAGREVSLQRRQAAGARRGRGTGGRISGRVFPPVAGAGRAEDWRGCACDIRRICA